MKDEDFVPELQNHQDETCEELDGKEHEQLQGVVVIEFGVDHTFEERPHATDEGHEEE